MTHSKSSAGRVWSDVAARGYTGPDAIRLQTQHRPIVTTTRRTGFGPRKLLLPQRSRRQLGQDTVPTLLRSGDPEEAGMAAALMRQAARLAEAWVAEGHTSGLVVLVARRGVVVLHEAFGRLSPEAGAPAPFNPGMRPVLRALQTAPGSCRRDANHPDEWFCGHDGVRLPARIPERREPCDARTCAVPWDRCR